MTLTITLFFILMSTFSSETLPVNSHVPVRFLTSKTFILTNPCNTEKSILIRNNSLHEFDHKQSQWKRLCVPRTIFDEEIPLVTSIVHLNNDLILIIHGTLFRTDERIISSESNDIIYKVFRYSNIPILSEKIAHVFTTPCCSCSKGTISYAFNDYIILADQNGNVILFSFKSMTVIYDFGNIFQSQSICQSSSCVILHLGLVHSVPTLICILQYQIEKAMIYHHPFLESNSTFSKPTFINYTGDTLYITPTTFHNAYFFWDTKKVFYTSNGGRHLSEVMINGCQFDGMNEDQLKIYYTNLDIDYDNITILAKDMYCSNKTIDYLFISSEEFFILTENSNQWFYGKESFLPSMLDLRQGIECRPFRQDLQNLSLPLFNFNITQCLPNNDQPSLPCSSFVQSSCFYTRFEPLFDTNQIYILEKNRQEHFQFILEAYTIIPIMIISTESMFLNYSINYTINRLNSGTVQTIGNILVSITNETSNDLYGSSLISLRLGLIQHGYSCTQAPSFSFQIETSCSSTSILYVEKNTEHEFWNQSNPIIDIEWIRQNLPVNAARHFSSVYIKQKQSDSIVLNYQYCFNHTCQSIDNDQLDILLIYAIPVNKIHENYAHYLINRSDSCVPVSSTVYRLWYQWTLNMTARTQLVQIPYERRTFYRTLLNMFSISNHSCLFFNASNPLHINESLNQATDDHLKFILHIIAYNNKLSFCDLETFILIEIEPIRKTLNTYRGFAFLITLLIFILLFILFISIYSCYKYYQRKKYLEYHRLNQIDAGQFHQWHDVAKYLHDNQHTDKYNLMQNYLRNLQSTTNLTKRLTECRT